MTQTTLPVAGMTCDHCVHRVREALQQLPGVESAEVSLARHEAVIDHDSPEITRSRLVEAVQAAGYRVAVETHENGPSHSASGAGMPLVQLGTSFPQSDASEDSPSGAHRDTWDEAAQVTGSASPPGETIAPSKTSSAVAASVPLRLDVQGMHCASCVSRVESALGHVEGVQQAMVNLTTAQATVELDAPLAEDRSTVDHLIEQLIEAVRRAGYDASPAEARATSEDWTARLSRESSRWGRRLVVSLALLVGLVVLPRIGIVGVWLAASQWITATLLMSVVGWPYLHGAWKRLMSGSTSMDTLIALGTGTAYVAGTVACLQGGSRMYFTDAAMILSFITLGRYLEARAKGRASSAIRGLLNLSPPMALVMENGTPRQAEVQSVAIGQRVLIRPGAKVPLDARIVGGDSSLDESWLTGESVPVDKATGDEIFAGTINGGGSLEAEVVRASGQTTLDQVVELVRHAQETRPEIQRIADRVVAWFVPAVLIVALITLLVWGAAVGDWSAALQRCVAVLVVACPCALGLATPTAVLVGSGRGAESGILVKDAQALETAGRLTTVVLDKTGTITRGKREVVDVMPAEGVASYDLLSVAAAVEQLSDHPLAAAIVTEAHRWHVGPTMATDLKVIPRVGISATVAEQLALAGNEALMDSHAIALPKNFDDLEAHRQQGHTVILVAHGNRFLGGIAVADTVAPGSAEAVSRLKELGLNIVLLSGDHQTTAEAIAHEVGITRVMAEVSPADKADVIANLQAEGESVAMVGDGINDAPALAVADMGIAIGSGADVAIETADVVLTGGDLRLVPYAVALSRATLRTIHQNLVWAFGYNTLLIPLAAGVLAPLGITMPPAAAAAAMAASSVSVVLNSLLLRHKRLGSHA
jgi:heavy metal translocating P-type ATPase